MPTYLECHIMLCTPMTFKSLKNPFFLSQVRYEAVERVTVVFRFLPDNVWRKNSASVKSVLSHAFCCFIACMDDLTAQVSQQATLMLGMVKVSHCFTE